jgi:hypothetical protein
MNIKVGTIIRVRGGLICTVVARDNINLYCFYSWKFTRNGSYMRLLMLADLEYFEVISE